MIIADTGFWVALLFRRDTFHRLAAETYRRYKGSLITTWPMLIEACYLLGSRVDPEAAAALLDRADRAFAVWPLPEARRLKPRS